MCSILKAPVHRCVVIRLLNIVYNRYCSYPHLPLDNATELVPEQVEMQYF